MLPQAALLTGCCKRSEWLILNSPKSAYTGQTIEFKLYLVTDRKLFADNQGLLKAVEESLKGGLKAVQLREKDLGIRELLGMAYSLRELTGRYGAALFINDRVDVALAVKADGVHLGQESVPAYAARKASKGGLIVGVSTHSLAEAVESEKDGADFITLGPVYHTDSKAGFGYPLGPDTLKNVCAAVSLPVFAIGGVKSENLKEVRICGAKGAAVISAILCSDNIKQTTENFLRCMK